MNRAGKCGRRYGGKVRLEIWRESAAGDTAGHTVRLGAWQESATAKARDTCIAESKMASNRLS